MFTRSLVLLLVSASLVVEAQQTASRIGRVLEGAYQQIGKTTIYDGSYRRLSFPGGDVPLERGVCTDVIVRAYRHAGLDLQVLVNQDMTRSFHAYPQLWGLSRPDSNIDHRRVPNLAAFFKRHGTTLPISTRASDYTAGDIVTWLLASGVPHIGFVADRREGGRPLIIHNIGAGARAEDVLFSLPSPATIDMTPDAQDTPLNVGMVLFPNLTQLDLTGPYEVFARLPGTKVHLIASTVTPVRSERGLTIAPDTTLENAPELDILFVPGGPGVDAMMENEALLGFLRARASRARYVTSVCTGALVLGAAGLLHGYRAATHWLSQDLLALFGAEAVDERVVIDRNRITGGGITAGTTSG